ncbi:hypothetical protein KP77_21900 [Jeotgalibacillus alimentarius]|uniref:DUF309 domain-containing protein n=1 Tax=Jeotgalibacillus alimentarius TaxID=135826 RepID=A0A0C2S4N8_9BACL|nr:DUF309 domain-containing protein [Jeotgalibacillus alimentarius]KIL48979.1 hypothetical protein KP77_21900 [Jeotgalibacillus alimentarius]
MLTIKKYPDSYIQFLVHFHGDRDYFECHEVLEEYWKENTDRNKHSIWVGLIQLSVALYHHRRGNFSGAFRMIRQSKEKILSFTDAAEHLSIDTDSLIQLITELEGAIRTHSPYQSVMIPLTDQDLVETCRKICSDRGYSWGSTSDLQDKLLIDRHKLRDRTDIISMRQHALISKSRSSHNKK